MSYTAEIVRRQQTEGYMRLREQMPLILEVLKPIAERLGEKIREVYPETASPMTNGDR